MARAWSSGLFCRTRPKSKSNQRTKKTSQRFSSNNSTRAQCGLYEGVSTEGAKKVYAYDLVITDYQGEVTAARAMLMSFTADALGETGFVSVRQGRRTAYL